MLQGAALAPLAVLARRSRAAAPAEPATRAALKPLMTGLATRTGSVPAHEVATGAVTAVVAPLNWSDIETSPGRFSAAKLEQALGTALGTGLASCRLRVSMGAGAPGDLLSNGIGQFNQQRGYYNPQDGTYAPMPLWWTTQYTGRATALLAWLARRYDTDGRIADIAFSAPCTFYSEWPIRQLAKQNFAVLRSAKYTTAADQAAIETMTTAYAAHFSQTRITFADSQIWEDWAPPSTVRQDNGWHTTFLAHTRSLLGHQAVHGTNNLAANAWGGQNYRDVLALGPPYSFQTQTLAKLGQPNLPATIEQAINHGVSCVELPDGYASGAHPLTISQMHSYSQRLARNAVGY